MRRAISVLIALILFSPSAQSATASISSADNLSKGLVAYYPLNNSAADASGNGNNGTMVSVSAAADRVGVEGAALLFDSSSYVVTEFTPLQTLRNEFTISVWLKLAESCERCRIVMKNTEYDEVAGQDLGAPEYGLYIEGQVPTVHLNWEQPGDEYASSVAVETNVWTHLLVRVRPNSVEFYLNGELVTSFNEEIKIPPVLDREPFVIGSGGSTGGSLPVYSFQGALDDLLIYNRGLSDSEISAVFAGESVDADDDGVPDWLDAFPSDSAEQFDTDSDGEGNAADSDDDNDGVLDGEDPLPTMPHSSGVENLLSTITDRNLRACLEESAQRANYTSILQFERIECNSPAGLSDREPILSLEGLQSLVNLRSVSIAGYLVLDFSGLSGLPIRDISYYPINSTYSYFDTVFSAEEQAKLLDPVSSMLGLSETLELLDTPIDNLAPLAGLPKISRLGLRRFDDNWPQNFQGQFNLSDLNSVSDEITHLYLADFNLADILFIERLPQLRELFISDYRLERSRLTDISALERIANPAGIQKLVFENQGIEDISPLAQMEGLIFLKLAGLQVSDLTPISQLSTLETLVANSNQIRDLRPLATLENLWNLELQNNLIDDLSPLSQLPLRRLFLNNNQIVDLAPLSGLQNLYELYLHDNLIAEIGALSELSALQFLNLQNNQIVDLAPLSGLSKLELLELSGNRIADLSHLSKLLQLGFLGLSENNIVDISPLASLTNVDYLLLRGNQISDITALSGLSKLRYLDLRDNRISDFSPITDLIEGMDQGYFAENQNPDDSGEVGDFESLSVDDFSYRHPDRDDAIYYYALSSETRAFPYDLGGSSYLVSDGGGLGINFYVETEEGSVLIQQPVDYDELTALWGASNGYLRLRSAEGDTRHVFRVESKTDDSDLNKVVLTLDSGVRAIDVVQKSSYLRATRPTPGSASEVEQCAYPDLEGFSDQIQREGQIWLVFSAPKIGGAALGFEHSAGENRFVLCPDTPPGIYPLEVVALDGVGGKKKFDLTVEITEEQVDGGKVEWFPLGTVPGDMDGDGIADDIDAFPNDPAASVDTDGDGKPDDWNEGKSEADSTSDPALVIDDDDDGDGIPDEAEESWGMDPLVDDASEDLDGDGMSNLREWRLGTNAQDPDSFNQFTEYDETSILEGHYQLGGDGLTVTSTSNQFDWIRSIDFVEGGKHYWEITINCGPDSAGFGFGIIDADATLAQGPLDEKAKWIIGTDGTRKIHGGTSKVFDPEGFLDSEEGDVFQVALDLDGREVFFGKNGTWLGSAEPDEGQNPAFDGIPQRVYAMHEGQNRDCAILESTSNFGNSTFKFEPPPGFFAGYCPESNCEISTGDRDADGDGVLDNEDNFPNDPAASLDTDGDGKPDDWNEGKSEADSTSDPVLVLDDDDDGDGVPDLEDAYPYDGQRSVIDGYQLSLCDSNYCVLTKSAPIEGETQYFFKVMGEEAEYDFDHFEGDLTVESVEGSVGVIFEFFDGSSYRIFDASVELDSTTKEAFVRALQNGGGKIALRAHQSEISGGWLFINLISSVSQKRVVIIIKEGGSNPGLVDDLIQQQRKLLIDRPVSAEVGLLECVSFDPLDAFDTLLTGPDSFYASPSRSIPQGRSGIEDRTFVLSAGNAQITACSDTPPGSYEVVYEIMDGLGGKAAFPLMIEIKPNSVNGGKATWLGPEVDPTKCENNYCLIIDEKPTSLFKLTGSPSYFPFERPFLVERRGAGSCDFSFLIHGVEANDPYEVSLADCQQIDEAQKSFLQEALNGAP
jgi:Leucine-rich repeat (LRR) protein